MTEMTSMPIDAETVRQLVAEAQQGDRTAADQLVRQHDSWVRSAIYAACGRRELVDDVAQQVWISVWQKLGSLDNPRRLKPWLYSIARNAAIDAGVAQRKHQTRFGWLSQALRLATRDHQAPDRVAAGHETQAALLAAIRSLPAIYREPFVLRHVEDWSYAEIGEVLNLPVQTVETRLVRARRMLRELLSTKVLP